MSFNWKGLLGVNSASNSQLASSSGSTPLTPTSINTSSSNHVSTSAAQANGPTSPTSPSVSSHSQSSAKQLVNTTPLNAHSAAPSLFSNIMAGSPSSALMISSLGATPSPKKSVEIPTNTIDGGGPLLGMENFGNTCYANSMLQALYFCRPFRDSVLSYTPASAPDQITNHLSETSQLAVTGSLNHVDDGIPPQETLFAALRDLFQVMLKDGQQKSFPSPSKSSFGSSSLVSPIASPVSSGAGSDHSGVSRKPSILGRSATLSSTGRGGLGNHSTPSPPILAAKANATTSASSASSVPIAPAPGTTPGTSQPTLSVSTSTNGSSNALAVDSYAVKSFLAALKRENVLFDSTMHQDAHEMLNFVLNKVGEDLIQADTAIKGQNPVASPKSRPLLDQVQPDMYPKVNVRDVGPNANTCVHRLFEGTLTNETRCLTCETVTSRDESFLDLSIDIEHNSSVTSCLRQFSASEMLQSRNKFFCDSCSGLQEAEKRMKIKKLPNVLALHLKRFKYEESVQRYVKLAYRVAFPLELRLFNTSDDAEDPDRLFELFAIVVHIGAGPHHGHYIAVIKVGNRWVQFDDDTVSYIDESEIHKYYGDRPGIGSAYVLFYQAVDLDFESLGLEPPVVSHAAASSNLVEERGRLSTPTNQLHEPIRPSPERSGTISPRSRLGSVSEAATLSSLGSLFSATGSSGPFHSPSTLSESVSSSSGGGGWLGSFRNREKRAGSQSQRRRNTTSSVEVLGSDSSTGVSTPTSRSIGGHTSDTPASSRIKRTNDSDGASPDSSSISTAASASRTSVNGIPSTVAAPAIARSQPPGLVSPVQEESVVPDESANLAAYADAAVSINITKENDSTISHSPSKTNATLNHVNGDSHAVSRETCATTREANQLQPEQNMLKAEWNRDGRARAASEGSPLPTTLAEPPALLCQGIVNGRSNFSPLLTEQPCVDKLDGTISASYLPQSGSQTPSSSVVVQNGDSSATPTLSSVGLPIVSTTNESSHQHQQSIQQAQTDLPSNPSQMAFSNPFHRASNVIAAGAAFSPAERPITKKEQKQIAKNARRSSSVTSNNYAGGSALHSSHTSSELLSKGHDGIRRGSMSNSSSTGGGHGGRFSNLFGNGNNNQNQPNQKNNNINHNSTRNRQPSFLTSSSTPASGAATPVDPTTTITTTNPTKPSISLATVPANQTISSSSSPSHSNTNSTLTPNRKPSLTTKSISRTFGFRRSSKT